VETLTWPIPLELFAFGLESTLARLGDDVTLRPNTPPSPDGGVIGDYRGPGRDDPASLMVLLEGDPGVAAQGLFPPSLVSEIFVARGDQVERLTIA
jgi:ribose 5-phosphate isomerase A